MQSVPQKPTPAELEILRVLWDLGPATVRSVCEALNRNRPTGYTTVLKLMQIMAEKGLVKRDESARAHVYSAARKREHTQRQLLGDLLDRAFDGSAAHLLQHALQTRRTSAAEIAEIRAILDRYERGEK